MRWGRIEINKGHKQEKRALILLSLAEGEQMTATLTKQHQEKHTLYKDNTDGEK